MPCARTWLSTIGIIKSTANIHHDMVVLTIQTSQYVSGSQSTIKTADFEIIIRHYVNRKYLYNRTTKAKLGSKVSLIGELDIHNDKLCLELHNFDCISTNTTQYTSSTPTSSSSSASSSTSEKRSLLYESLTSDKNLSHTLPYENKNQIRKGFIYVAINEDNLVDDPPVTKKNQKAFRFSVYQTDATSF